MAFYKIQNENSNLILYQLLSFRLNMAIHPLPSLPALSWWFSSWARLERPIQRLSHEVGSRQLAPDLRRKAFFWSVFANWASAEAFILGCELGSFPRFIGLQAIALDVRPGHHTYSNSFSNASTQWGPNLSLQRTSFLGPPLTVPLVFHHLHSLDASSPPLHNIPEIECIILPTLPPALMTSPSTWWFRENSESSWPSFPSIPKSNHLVQFVNCLNWPLNMSFLPTLTVTALADTLVTLLHPDHYNQPQWLPHHSIPDCLAFSEIQ